MHEKFQIGVCRLGVGEPSFRSKDFKNGIVRVTVKLSLQENTLPNMKKKKLEIMPDNVALVLSSSCCKLKQIIIHIKIQVKPLFVHISLQKKLNPYVSHKMTCADKMNSKYCLFYQYALVRFLLDAS